MAYVTTILQNPCKSNKVNRLIDKLRKLSLSTRSLMTVNYQSSIFQNKMAYSFKTKIKEFVMFIEGEIMK